MVSANALTTILEISVWNLERGRSPFAAGERHPRNEEREESRIKTEKKWKTYRFSSEVFCFDACHISRDTFLPFFPPPELCRGKSAASLGCLICGVSVGAFSAQSLPFSGKTLLFPRRFTFSFSSEPKPGNVSAISRGEKPSLFPPRENHASQCSERSDGKFSLSPLFCRAGRRRTRQRNGVAFELPSRRGLLSSLAHR